jgi:SnoaL-like protein
MTDSIRTLIEGWVIWRDAGFWTELRGAWHDDGRMHSSWFQGPAPAFVDACRTGFEAGALVHHTLGGTWTTVRGLRAIAQTKVVIGQRVTVHGVLCDVVGTGRFYDFFEKRDGAWRIVLRQPIYEKDRLDPVHAHEYPDLDRRVLDGFPAGCRHMLYAQQHNGMPVMTDLPQLRGPVVRRLYTAGETWLTGGALAF